MLGTILALHGLIGWGLLQPPVERGRTAPPPPALAVHLLAASPAPASPALPLVPLPPRATPTTPVLPVPEVELMPPATPARPATLVDQNVEAPVTPAPPPTVALPPRSGPAPTSPPPLLIPATALQYLVWPDITYPAASRRLNETGLVVVAVYVDADGRPREVQIYQSSGHERLDRAALAGVRAARFRPVIQDGRPVAGWARIPIPFELER